MALLSVAKSENPKHHKSAKQYKSKIVALVTDLLPKPEVYVGSLDVCNSYSYFKTILR